jgi:hypothetical protein
MLLGPEFRWVLNDYTPEAIPMARLIEYMRELCKLLGHEDCVHFVRLERSSTVVVTKTNLPAVASKIEARVKAARRGDGPLEPSRAYETINNMLAEDGKSARFCRGSAVIINFPGTIRATPTVIKVQDTGSVTGYLYMLYEQKDGFHARLRVSADTSLQCTCSKDALLELKECLFGAVRVYGNGRWKRADDGSWLPISLKIERVQRVSTAPLRDVIDSLRKLDIAWPEDPLGVLVELNEEDGVVQ